LHNLDEYTINDIKNLEEQDYNFYRVYTLGEWGRLENLIYSNWDILPINHFPKDPDEIIYGLDFGFNNPTAMVKIQFKDKCIYEEELIYQSSLTPDKLITRLDDLLPANHKKNKLIYCDSENAEAIQMLQNAGYNAMPAEKGKNSVFDGITRVKMAGKIHISMDSVNLIREKRGYSWKVTKDKKTLDEPVKFNDHLMDAERYALYMYLPRLTKGFSDEVFISEDRVQDF